MKDWLEDLLDEYPTKQSDKAIARLVRVYADTADPVMRRAVDQYLLHERFFPKVADLRPYVDQAIEESRGMEYANAGERFAATDADLYAMEVERGTMPPMDELHNYWDVIVMAAGAEILAELPY